MIHQLGPPTFFFTFINAKIKWTDLLKTLHELKNYHNKDIKDIKIEDEDICELVRGDVITCA
jgi:hypothetical protein